MMKIAYEYIGLSEPTQEGASSGGSSNLARGVKVLETVSRFMPGLLSIKMALAQASINMGSHDKALRLLGQSLKADPTYIETYIRLARLYSALGQKDTAAKYLEQGFAQDFGIRSHPLYAAVRAEGLMIDNRVQEAIKLLREAIEVDGIRQKTGKNPSQKASKGLSFTLGDRSMLFRTFIEALNMGDLTVEAKRLQEDAMVEFSGTNEESTIIVAGAEIAVRRGDIGEALTALSRVPPSSASYTKARLAMGDIFKNHKKDKKAYAQCYMDVCNHEPSAVNLTRLGDAYITILEPTLAIEAFEKARRLDKSSNHASDHNLVKKIARAWTQMHDYEKAIECYKAALKRADSMPISACSDLRRDLAKLYLDLGRYQECIQEMERHLSVPHDEASTDQVADRVKSFLLLSRAYQKELAFTALQHGDARGMNLSVPQSLEALKAAKETSLKSLAALGFVLGKSSVTDDDEEDGDLHMLRKLAADVHYQLGMRILLHYSTEG
ncbi:conserved hypothetical protein [Perkinsus marinus ATCC 50983]|uniref:Uncharacterized protein n=1 Tax=Perkinsus marinus (strain ATCC 50983 / TXsc) TaxID=423536 RepID=C5KVI0_PERM5|nr:conserved hypothetical protein [Perkinsus marinus ATCC 50983]EER11513.1 conserved hypothetical protein [Perkinsus marinus ATCC 50983]|eukprot:XP_002779718.1 conserved hypothetical protein [Perkinsus marinus ATCC 50983]